MRPLHPAPRLPGLLAAVALAIAFTAPAGAAEKAVVIPPPAVDLPATTTEPQTAVLAGGCFWGVQGVFQHTAGVLSAVSGYAGGDKSTAFYEMVSDGQTGHAESVEIKYDPGRISYGKILQIFFSVAHNPTQLNRQGPDIGTQYRSAIFIADTAQKKVADAYIAQLNAARVFDRPIVTTVDPLKGFYPAEDYHQDYLTLHPRQPYIVHHDLPKIESLKTIFADRYIEKPTLVNAGKTAD